MKYLLLILLSFNAFALDLNSSLVTNESMGADVTSSNLALDSFSNFAIYAKYTGTPNGEIKLEASLDNTSSPTNWVQVGGSAVTIIGADDVIWNMSNASYKWIRVKYVRTSGTGTLNVNYNVKVGK